MGRHDFQTSVKQAIVNMLADPEVQSRTGVAKFTQSDKRTQGKLFFRRGKAYAIELTNYPVGVLRRILSSEYISEEHKEQIVNHFKDMQDSPLITDYVLTYQMIPERPLTTFVKDYFLGAFDELISWEAVNAEWRDGEETDNFTVPFVEPSKLIELADNRKKFLEKIAQEFTVSAETVSNLKFRVVKTPTTEVDQTGLNLLPLGNGESTVIEASRQLGLSLFLAIKSLFSLWEEEVLEMIYDNEFPIRHQIHEAVKEEDGDSIPLVLEESESISADADLEAPEEVKLGLQEETDELPLEPQKEDEEVNISRPSLPVVVTASTPMVSASIPDSISAIAKRLVEEVEALRLTIDQGKEALTAKELEVNALTENINEKISALEELKAAHQKDSEELTILIEQYNSTVAFVKQIG